MALAFSSTMRFLQSLAVPGFLLLTLLLGTKAVASIPRESMALDVQNIVPVLPKEGINAQDVNMVVPTNIPNGANSDVVQQKVLDQSMKSVLEGKMIKSEFVQSAKKLESAMRPNLSLWQSPSGVKHELQME